MLVLPFLSNRDGQMIALTPLERKAAFVAAVTLRQSTRMRAAKEIGVSWQHLRCVLEDERVGSLELKRRIAIYVGLPIEQLFPDRQAA